MKKKVSQFQIEEKWRQAAITEKLEAFLEFILTEVKIYKGKKLEIKLKQELESEHVWGSKNSFIIFSSATGSHWRSVNSITMESIENEIHRKSGDSQSSWYGRHKGRAHSQDAFTLVQA